MKCIGPMKSPEFLGKRYLWTGKSDCGWYGLHLSGREENLRNGTVTLAGGLLTQSGSCGLGLIG